MKKILLRFDELSTPQEVQKYLAGEFQFPDYYGMNLDALYDELTVIDEELCVGIYLQSGKEELRPYLFRIARVFLDAESENPHLAVIFDQPEILLQ